MNAKLDPNVFTKSLDAINTAGKIVANLTDPKKPQQPANLPQPKPNNNNQPHTQTVEVKVGNPDGQKDKPVILHEKKETHVHKAYPDGRALSKDECEVEKLRIQTAHENMKEEREYNREMESYRREERREREEYERAEKERAREERKRRERKGTIICTTLGLAALAAGVYCVYTDYRNTRNPKLPVSTPEVTVNIPNKSKPIKAEGTVK